MLKSSVKSTMARFASDRLGPLEYKVNDSGVASDVIRLGENVYFVTLGVAMVRSRADG